MNYSINAKNVWCYREDTFILRSWINRLTVQHQPNARCWVKPSRAHLFTAALIEIGKLLLVKYERASECLAGY